MRTIVPDMCGQARRILAVSWAFVAPAASIAGAALLLGACVNAEGPKLSPVQSGLNCVDDSFDCRSSRQAALRTMLSDSNHGWVRQPVTAEAYASGVRLFAFKQRKKSLSCEELAIGVREAKEARPTLRAASSRLTPAQISRGAMLGDEVGRELQHEKRRRCRT